MTDAAPLILSLALDPASQARLGQLRQAHFPPARNHLPAHLTLFHALPGAALPEVGARLAALAAATAPMPLRFAGWRGLGRGVACAVASPPLLALRAGLAGEWRDWLTPQDRQGFRPHVTVQNKVAPEAARALLTLLEARVPPWAGLGRGLLLWHYRGGPWEAAGEFPFTA
ncbi:phosphoesterase HXTX [Pseudoroseomonas rhizosphaerae]|uniref:Phosphoesterase HXTX n=1 Tax=Teichococcus rhizosphaerae TaxID=1335062 RepID=A0A2C7ADW5_9PROT|nr:2'-5' RNA ligase family protein [Pseudoroseomonas rhizosphaerae]PHK95833.1 phosphoesterase HXTX [Pseudoroseomonas rhizosphaerae]